MAEADLMADLTAVFRDVFDEPAMALRPETTAADIKGWDSAQHIMLVVAIEVHFDIKFTTAEIEGLQNVGALLAVIERKLARRRA